MSAPVLEVRNLLVMRNGMPALDVPSLSIEEGRVVSLIGPNGAGKSTLLLSLMRLVRSESGDVLYRGKIIPPGKTIHRQRRKMAMVFQEPLLFSSSVYGNIASGLRIRSMSRKEIRMAAEENMELLGITHLAKRRAGALSGGEAQRVNLARALAVAPDVLLMDEPFSSLDAPTRESLITDLERIIRDRRITTLFATHDRGEALRLADEIIVMNGGVIEQAGAPADIMRYPASEFVASFMGTETILAGEVTASGGGVFTLSANGVSIEAAGHAERGSTVTFCIHPDNIVFSSVGQKTSARNSFSGRISKIIPMGLFRKVYVDCGFILVAYVTNPSIEEIGIREGKEIFASFKATAVHVIRTDSPRQA